VLVADGAKRKELGESATAKLLEHAAALAAAGLAPEIVSAGGTGTYDQTGSTPGITEIQAGSYVFMDGRYLEVRSEFEPALTLHTTVIHRRGRLLITDAGVKSLSSDFGLPRGADLPLRVVGLSEEHGHVLVDEGADVPLAPGDRLRILPSHGDTTINLHDRYYAARATEVGDLADRQARTLRLGHGRTPGRDRANGALGGIVLERGSGAATSAGRAGPLGRGRAACRRCRAASVQVDWRDAAGLAAACAGARPWSTWRASCSRRARKATRSRTC
jgi:hypothetical protein